LNKGGPKDRVRINEMIRVPQVRLIAEDGEQLGIMSPRDALTQAESRGLDLVEVAPQANPPVCRIMDYGKYLYMQKKRAQEAKKHQKSIQVKEIKFRPKIDLHDYNFKKNHIIKFLNAGNHVKVVIMYRGREIVHIELGAKLLDKLVEELGETIKIERSRQMEGRTMTVILAPNPQGQKKKSDEQAGEGGN
jgi:translation initiation factor IF-3